MHASSRTLTRRRVTDARTTTASAAAPASAAPCMPWVNASPGRVAGIPARPGRCPAAASAPPSVSWASAGAESGISRR
ncbi:hypothetical protein SGLAM104S_09287 [Streptomyces glaucescens]